MKSTLVIVALSIGLMGCGADLSEPPISKGGNALLPEEELPPCILAEGNACAVQVTFDPGFPEIDAMPALRLDFTLPGEGNEPGYQVTISVPATNPATSSYTFDLSKDQVGLGWFESSTQVTINGIAMDAATIDAIGELALHSLQWITIEPEVDDPSFCFVPNALSAVKGTIDAVVTVTIDNVVKTIHLSGEFDVNDVTNAPKMGCGPNNPTPFAHMTLTNQLEQQYAIDADDYTSQAFAGPLDEKTLQFQFSFFGEKSLAYFLLIQMPWSGEIATATSYDLATLSTSLDEVGYGYVWKDYSVTGTLHIDELAQQEWTSITPKQPLPTEPPLSDNGVEGEPIWIMGQSGYVKGTIEAAITYTAIDPVTQAISPAQVHIQGEFLLPILGNLGKPNLPD